MIDVIGGASVAGLLSVWLLYPLLITCLAALKRRQGPRWGGEPPSVSVVIATNDSAEAVEKRVRNCLESDYPVDRLEVVVAVDWRCQVPEPGQVGESRRMRVVQGAPPGGKAGALNAGVAAAVGDVIVFADTHQRFAADTVRLLVDVLQDPRVGAATGRLELPAPEGRPSVARWYWRFECWLREREALVHSSVGVTGAVYAMRRHLWTPLPANLIVDDLYVPMTLILDGWRVAFVREALAFETRSPTPAQEYARKVRTLTGILQLCVWLPSVVIPIRNPVWLQFLFHKLLRFLTPLWTIGILIWTAAMAGRVLGPHLPAGLVVASCVVLWIVAAPSRVARRVRSAVLEMGLLQYATVVSVGNAVLGHWDVWQTQK